MNKSVFTLLIGLFLCQAVYAQDESDALRYSWLTPGGTARMQAIGGANVSLGGDPSNMDMNPAGIALFKTNDFSITPGFRYKTNDAEYLGNSMSDSKGSLFLQQFGLVFASNRKQNSNSRWQNVTFGVGLNRLANFNQNLYYQGENKSSSYSDNYQIRLIDDGETNYDNISKNYPFGVSQAFITGLIYPQEDNSGRFTGWYSLPSQVLDGGHSITQSNSISSKGGLNEFSLAVAGNYADKLYVGLSLNVPSINYDRTKTFTETNLDDPTAFMKHYDVEETLHTDGVGINGKLGLIYSINSMVRVGATFHSPTLYSMHDTYATTITTNTTDQGMLTSRTGDITGGYPGDYDYSLTTPWRMMGGISFIFGTSPDVKSQHGFASIDYEYVNYAASRFNFNGSNATAADKAQASELNSSIQSMYKGASNIRAGGELKFDIFALRAGVAWMGSPYKDSEIKSGEMRYSAGVGIRNRGFYADLSYIYAAGNGIDQPYFIKDNDMGIKSPPHATFNNNASNIILTFGLKL